MKKILLSGLLLLGALTAQAQIADESDAPDFSGTDVVTGEEVSLQAYLNQGKTVLVYMSAAWCGPCWQFHNTHVLTDLHNAFGPEGSNEMVIIYIEADWRTPEGEIFGTDLPQTLPTGTPAPPAPLGDWTADTPYHIINNDVVGDQYDIPGFPTMFAIKPNGVGEPGTVFEVERDTPAGLTAQISAVTTPLVGIDHWARVTSTTQFRSCDADGEMVATVESFGHALSSVEAKLTKDGETVATQTFEMELAGFEPGELNFGVQEFDAEAEYAVVLTKVNGEDPLMTIPDAVETSFTAVPNASTESYQNLKITIHTDEFPAEMRMRIINSEGSVKWNKPSYNATTGREKTFVHYVTLEDEDCYDILMWDTVGDGWDWNTVGTPEVPHGVTVESNGVVLFQHDGTFTTEVYQQASFHTNGALDNKKFEEGSFAIYPNPSNGVFNFTTAEAVDVTVVDIAGKVVHTAKGIADGGTMDLSRLQAGMYIAKIKGENTAERVEKLVIK